MDFQLSMRLVATRTEIIKIIKVLDIPMHVRRLCALFLASESQFFFPILLSYQGHELTGEL